MPVAESLRLRVARRGKRVPLQCLDCQRDEELKADALADHDSQVLVGELVERVSSETVNRGHEIRVVFGVAPIFASSS